MPVVNKEMQVLSRNFKTVKQNCEFDPQHHGKERREGERGEGREPKLGKCKK